MVDLWVHCWTCSRFTQLRTRPRTLSLPPSPHTHTYIHMHTFPPPPPPPSPLLTCTHMCTCACASCSSPNSWPAARTRRHAACSTSHTQRHQAGKSTRSGPVPLKSVCSSVSSFLAFSHLIYCQSHNSTEISCFRARTLPLGTTFLTLHSSNNFKEILKCSVLPFLLLPY